MPVEPRFDAACSLAKTFVIRPPDSQLLEIYSLYKQATIGDVDKSGKMNDPIAKAKWEAWNKKKGMSKEDAKKKYVSIIEEMAKAQK
ncbi:PREDICTED: acyl-CoA-binding protein homolog 1-like isoform X2 [Nicrophorus vespilloides]|uniref:Acyl-CoA-binding protein homolog 1-like isoform X2 n=1 Tax=Nicrophorus vespilloides TaxID=110193 RepID=A0ABM1MLX6_NICVS|nr:PREDICTED: acyl-CoA-binding protein homolog 1-like isoform X2 [Nicrophorus vespilloides]